jgi:hypothetical protein
MAVVVYTGAAVCPVLQILAEVACPMAVVTYTGASACPGSSGPVLQISVKAGLLAAVMLLFWMAAVCLSCVFFGKSMLMLVTLSAASLLCDCCQFLVVEGRPAASMRLVKANGPATCNALPSVSLCSSG